MRRVLASRGPQGSTMSRGFVVILRVLHAPSLGFGPSPPAPCPLPHRPRFGGAFLRRRERVGGGGLVERRRQRRGGKSARSWPGTPPLHGGGGDLGAYEGTHSEGMRMRGPIRCVREEAGRRRRHWGESARPGGTLCPRHMAGNLGAVGGIHLVSVPRAGGAPQGGAAAGGARPQGAGVLH